MSQPGPTAFQVLAKPVGAACNLNCRYCYYLRRAGGEVSRRMSDAVLDAYVRDSYLGQPKADRVFFSWQGGEPTLAGIEFFRKALALQAHYAPKGVRVVDALQTNATLIDDAWATFLAKNGFLVGVSIDGPVRLHDPLRRANDGRTTHHQVLRGFERLLRAGVECNTLTVVHRLNYHHGREVYRFLRRIGARHLQFIPLVERVRSDGRLAGPLDEDIAPAPWTAPPEGFGQFLCEAFDDWLASDVGSVFVQWFEEYAGVLAGGRPSLCVLGTSCATTPMLESNGDLYCCDHYAYPDYRLGNIRERSIVQLLARPRQVEFGKAKIRTLRERCLSCPHRAACHGGCPKHRFAHAGEDGAAISYLCSSYRRFFAHAKPALSHIVARVLSRPSRDTAPTHSAQQSGSIT